MRAVILVFTFLFISSSQANSPVVNSWLKILNSQSNSELEQSDQAFCYVNDLGKVEGYNVSKPLGLASVSKVLTSLWALNKLGKNHTFDTKLYIKGSDVHIEGGQDPVFARRSLYNMINQLNKMGVQSIRKLTYDSRFYFVPQAIDNSSHAQAFDGTDGIHYCQPYKPGSHLYKPLLEKYMNTQSWDKNYTRVSKSDTNSSGTGCLNTTLRTIQSDYANKRKVFTSFSSSPKLSVKTVRHQTKNPFIKNGRVMAGTRVLNLKSLTLIEILKYFNTVSSNLPADLMFHILGGTKQFRADMSALLLSVGHQNYKQFTSGSGIPFKTYYKGRWTRTVNRMSCETVLKILELFLRYTNESKTVFFDHFDKPLVTRNDKITKPYLAVSGVEGTIRKRFEESYQRNLVAKSGTLSDATSLAGTVNTKKGKKHFVFLNTFPVNRKSSQHIQISRSVTNQTIVKMFEYEGQKSAFSYTGTTALTTSRFMTFRKQSELREY